MQLDTGFCAKFAAKSYLISLICYDSTIQIPNMCIFGARRKLSLQAISKDQPKRWSMEQ